MSDVAFYSLLSCVIGNIEHQRGVIVLQEAAIGRNTWEDVMSIERLDVTCVLWPLRMCRKERRLEGEGIQIVLDAEG